MVKSGSPTAGTSSGTDVKYKGVRKRKWGKWVSEIRLPHSRDRIWLGSYDTPEKAARAFDAAQFCLRGISANFNFPNTPPDIAGAQSMSRAEIQEAAARFANDPVHQDRREPVEEDDSVTTSYSPSISDGAAASTAHIDADVAGLEGSFYDQLNLTTTLGSGNYVSDFGLVNGFGDFNSTNFYSPQPDNINNNSNNNNFDYGYNGEDTYDSSLYQGSFLWNF